MWQVPFICSYERWVRDITYCTPLVKALSETQCFPHKKWNEKSLKLCRFLYLTNSRSQNREFRNESKMAFIIRFSVLLVNSQDEGTSTSFHATKAQVENEDHRERQGRRMRNLFERINPIWVSFVGLNYYKNLPHTTREDKGTTFNLPETTKSSTWQIISSSWMDSMILSRKEQLPKRSGTRSHSEGAWGRRTEGPMIRSWRKDAGS